MYKVKPTTPEERKIKKEKENLERKLLGPQKPSTKKQYLQKNVNLEELSNDPNTITYDHDIEKFKEHIIAILVVKGKVKQSTAIKLLDEEGLEYIRLAFTHWTMMEGQDYEQLEILGDKTVNKSITWYLYRRFPDVKVHPRGAFIISEAVKKMIDKGTFSDYCKILGLDKFIRYRTVQYDEKDPTNERVIKRRLQMNNSMREDVFEAFFAAIEDLIDGKVMLGCGYAVAYNILTSLLDTQKIELDLNKLVTFRHKLKEVFDYQRHIGNTYDFGGIEEEKIEGSDKPSYILSLKLNILNDPTSTPDNIKGQVNQIRTFKIRNVVKADVAKERLSEQALEWLKLNYGIEWKPKL